MIGDVYVRTYVDFVEMGWILLRIRRHVSYVWWGLQGCRFFASASAAGYNVPYHVMQRMVQAVADRNMNVFEAMDMPSLRTPQCNQMKLYVICISKTLAGPSPSRILKMVPLHLERFESTYTYVSKMLCWDV